MSRGTGEALAAKLQHAATGKLEGMEGESRGACPNLLSGDTNNLKSLKLRTKDFKQAQESGRCSPSVQRHQRNRKTWGFGADQGAEPNPAPPGLQVDKSCRKGLAAAARLLAATQQDPARK